MFRECGGGGNVHAVDEGSVHEETGTMLIKICGITTKEDALAAEAAGADAIGVILFSDSLREIGLDDAAGIFRVLKPSTRKVCVSHTSSEDDLRAILTTGPDAVQISSRDLISPEGVQVIRVVEPGDSIPDDADAVIIDSSRGHGTPFDPVYACSVVRKAGVPVILAGGLTPENVCEAICRVRPSMVDVATGVEYAPGKKDHEKVRMFIAAVRGCR
ncbi:phosphoribosylanthranilate isomerase [Methanovulcanius yangii]|uniref:phosphoribosylanthranilate isomerase n=1 Tax=Methanovulcanius yangii TaxID=1789227 RepID=UPI0029C9DFB4|nr:phosphoribosylanthranilate isomerase [Methanovulcanius yangii]